MKKAVLIIIIVTLLSKILGFLQNVVLSYFYGASNISDAYLLSITIPLLLYTIVAEAISAGYIPTYKTIEKEEGRENAIKFSSNFLNSIFIINTIIVILVLIFSKQLVSLFATGFSLDTTNITIRFLRITIFAIYFRGIVAILKGFLQIHNQFFLSSIMVVPRNVLIILGIIISYYYNVEWIVISFLIGSAVQVLILLPKSIKLGFKIKFSFNIFDKNLKKILLITAPLIIGIAANDVNQLIDKNIASNISEGAISAISYSNSLINFVSSITVLAFTQVFFPTLSKKVVNKDKDGISKIMKNGINTTLILILPIM